MNTWHASGHGFATHGINRRLRVEQTSHQKMMMSGVAKAVIDVSAETTAIYQRYDTIAINVPEEARRILNP